MPDFITSSILGETLTVGGILICTVSSLIFGLILAGIFMVRNTYSKGFVLTLSLLPAIVQAVIMMVNGNIGAGVAVAGAFSLVRFRSVPGSARDILSVFFAMAVGLATGMGYIFFALLFLIIVGAASLLLVFSKFGDKRNDSRILRVTIPENLDYENIFDDLFSQYTKKAKLERVKTTNMGSLYELTYDIELKEPDSSKSFIDELRCRNGNLNIILSRPTLSQEEL